MRIFMIVMCSIIAIVAYIVSYFQFRGKGVLLNNAYLYASTEEREKMDKKPYYRQSGVAFSLVGTIFVLNVVQITMKWAWVFYFVIVMGVAAIIYAIVSSVRIEKKK